MGQFWPLRGGQKNVQIGDPVVDGGSNLAENPPFWGGQTYLTSWESKKWPKKEENPPKNPARDQRGAQPTLEGWTNIQGRSSGELAEGWTPPKRYPSSGAFGAL
jgi:hypothetical protein